MSLAGQVGPAMFCPDHFFLRIRISPDICSAVETCGRAGQWRKALWLLSKVRDDKIVPDTRVLTAVIDALGRYVQHG